jgi:methyl-accepting chemotaxis protein
MRLLVRWNPSKEDAMQDDNELSPPPRRRGLDRLPLHAQLAVLIGALVLLVTVTSVVAIALVVRIGDDGENLADRGAYQESIGSAALAAKTVANDERGYLITGELKYRREATTSVDETLRAFRAASAAATTSVQRQAIASSREQFARWADAVRGEFATYRGGEHDQAIALAVGQNRALRKQYERSLDAAGAMAVLDESQARHTVKHRLTQSVAILIACLILSLALSAAIGIWLAYAIVRPMQRLISLLGDAEYVRIV